MKQSRCFRPPWWAWLLATAGCVLTVALGCWQLQRAEAKKALLANYLRAATAPAQPLDAGVPAGSVPQAVSAHGVYEAEHQLLLDNQAYRERPGYQVWTPLRLADGTRVIVNRGWVPRFERREQPTPLPAPAGELEVHGIWRALPQPGLRLAPGICRKGENFPEYVIYPSVAELHCLLAAPVADGVLLLDPLAAGGYVREWNFSEAIPPERHYAYAVQWFALALTVLFLFIKLNWKQHE